jgi:hypothetical protein
MLLKLLVFCVLALLICNAARSFASGLARSLALTAATVLNGFSNILSFNCLNSAHCKDLRIKIFYRFSIA